MPKGFHHSIIKLVLSATGLTACGGEAPVTVPPPDFSTGAASIRNGIDDLLSRHTENLIYTELVVLPTEATLTYRGYFFGEFSNSASLSTSELIGELAVTISFDYSGAAVTGSVGNFFDDSDRSITGNLTLNSGELNRFGNPNTDATLTFESNGSITLFDGEILDFGSAFEGDFLGVSFEAIGGQVFGRAGSVFGTHDFDGGFVGER